MITIVAMIYSYICTTPPWYVCHNPPEDCSFNLSHIIYNSRKMINRIWVHPYSGFALLWITQRRCFLLHILWKFGRGWWSVSLLQKHGLKWSSLGPNQSLVVCLGWQPTKIDFGFLTSHSDSIPLSCMLDL